MAHATRTRLASFFGAGARREGAKRRGRTGLAGVVSAMAPHDWIVLVPLVVLGILVLAGRGPTRGVALVMLAFDAAWLGAAIASVRAPWRVSPAASAFYRLSLIGVTVATYVEMRWILPVVAHGALDAELFALDLAVFRFEPALALDACVGPGATEWFSFFYYSYFFVLALYAIPIALAFVDGRALREFAFGLLAVYAVGHLTYVVVPAVGPHAYVHGFESSLDGGFFWELVRGTVDNAGAGKDVFPSLHTAAPLFLALYAFRHRGRPLLRYAWPVTAFVASQIIVATMYLRWHYLVDVLAGIALAVAVWLVAPHVAAWDARRRRSLGLGPAFPDSPWKAWWPARRPPARELAPSRTPLAPDETREFRDRRNVSACAPRPRSLSPSPPS